MSKALTISVIVVVLIVGGILAFVFWPRPVCYVDSDCGVNDYAESYCDGNIAKKDYVIYSCINPGTIKASCQQNKQPETIKECIYPYKCEVGSCQEQSCYELADATWLGGPASSRIFFNTPKQRNELIILAMKTGAEFKVHLYTDNNGFPDRKLKTWGPLNDDSIDDFQWIRLRMDGVESMPSAYYWVGIEVMEYGDSAFNTCTTNDRKPDTYGREDTITNGVYEEFNENRKTEHDMVYLFE